MPDARRRRALRGLGSRKDKTLQARIPKDLDSALRERAIRLGLPVSTIVRNVLLHTFDLVEGIVTDSVEIARAIGRPAASAGLPAPLADDESATLGWQEITLNVNAICDQCNSILPKGARAGVGIPVRARAVFLCRACMSSLADSMADVPEGVN
jgi:hypothetical protein